ncbi:MAG: hypothetical protein JWM62_2381 [Frankiales bacterium]|nr:hypothetical protein [Frankiales bacterium]
MTSRPVSGPSGTPAAVSPPGSRPHLPPVGSSERKHRRRAPLAWLPWLLLGLLALTLLGAALLAKVAGSSGSGDAAGTSGSGGSAASVAQQGDAPAVLSAGGQDLLGLPGGRVAELAGEQASGTARVESVVADEGFWVGSDATRRVFVFLTPEARRSAGESGFQVQAGQTVQLQGTVKPSSPEFARAAGVTGAEGAGQLASQGGYVEATEVRLAP